MTNIIPTKYAGNAVIDASVLLDDLIESDEDFDAGELIRRLIDVLMPWAARTIERIHGDHHASARLVAETMVIQYYHDRGELSPEENPGGAN